VYTHLALTPSIPLSQQWERGKKDQSSTFSPSPKLGRRGWGMRASPSSQALGDLCIHGSLSGEGRERWEGGESPSLVGEGFGERSKCIASNREPLYISMPYAPARTLSLMKAYLLRIASLAISFRIVKFQSILL
jgi:hypothetical protein